MPRNVLLLVVLLAVALVLVGMLIYMSTTAVEFSDPGLEALIREVLDRPKGKIYLFHLTGISELDAAGRGITCLEGIEYLDGLVKLNLEDNQVRDATPLKKLSGLTDLSLRNNGITDLDALNLASLRDLPLERLSLRHNVVRQEDSPQVRLSDISVLSNFTELRELELRDNHIADIEPLGALHNLEVLDISQNPLAGGDISFLGGLDRLTELNLRETGLGDIASLGELSRLAYLNLHSNPDIETIVLLERLVYLEVLVLRNVPVGKELVYLARLARLRRLNLRNCGLIDLSVLGRLMEQGALQDNPGRGLKAEVDLRDNPIPTLLKTGVDGYAPVRPYWENISKRYPESLPW